VGWLSTEPIDEADWRNRYQKIPDGDG